MPPSVISISSDSEDEADQPSASTSMDGELTISPCCPPSLNYLPLVANTILVSLREANGDDGGMDWEASPPANAIDLEADRLMQASFQPGLQDAPAQKQQAVVSFIGSDYDESPDSAAQTLIVQSPGEELVQKFPVVAIQTSVEPQDDKITRSSHIYPAALISVDLPKSTLVNPRSSFEGFEPPAKEITEHHLIQAIERGVPSQGGSDFTGIDLHNFSIYVDSKNYGAELRSLQALGTTMGSSTLYFDGEVRISSQTYFLKKVPFRTLPIDGYGLENETVRDQIWVHSVLNEKRRHEIYYRLRDPAPEYERYFTPFLWIADLAKHFIDFCDRSQSLGKRVVLANMKHHLYTYIKSKHHGSAIVAAWCAAHKISDFRVAIVANTEYLWKEAYGVSDDPSWHTIWKEIKTFDAYQPNLTVSPQLFTQNGFTISKTTVTPYIYRLFEHFDFGIILNASPLALEIQTARSQQVSRTSHHAPKVRSRSMRFPPEIDRVGLVTRIQPGDVISTHMDKPDVTATTWKLEHSVHHDENYNWMARVQHVHKHPATGARTFDVLWLYHPRDTSCGIMKYPWKKELFLSDNCTCHSKMTRIREDEILALYEVEWFGNELSTAEHFVRQIYFASQNRWERLSAKHFNCSIEEENIADLCIGETVLGPVPSGSHRDTDRLQPFLIEDLRVDNHGKQWATARELFSPNPKQAHREGAATNELYWSDKVMKLRTSAFQRRCFVRVIEANDTVPALYDLLGTGDLFFIRKTTENAKHLKSLRQGFDPSQNGTVEQLRGLDLFCGGGNFGRGLEEGSGAVRMNWANDISPEAMHTYMANNNGTCHPYLGSVDDLLHNIIQGDLGTPKPGDVNIVSGGSPCPGFSRLTIDKTTIQQQKNRSLSASFASFIDCLRPNFGVLENVKGIVESKRKDSCVLSQLVCALVGLGYQTQLMWLDAWSFGAPQSRERVFLCFAAPDCALPRMPEPSHSHPSWTKMTTLGKMSNGMPFSQRENVKTPFEFMTASAATADLPSVHDGKPDFCIGYPDHRLSVGYTSLLRKQLSAVPMRPFGLNFSKIAFSQNGEEPILSPSQLQIFGPQRGLELGKKRERASETSKGWGRVHPHGLFSTVTTACQPADARAGTWSHWSQNRPITILEARRAQGFHDDEVILGGPGNQWKVVGNSVSRHVAVVLGLAIREAWFGTLLEDRSETDVDRMED